MPDTLTFHPSQSNLSRTPSYCAGTTTAFRGTRLRVMWRYRPRRTPDDLEWMAMADESFAEDWDSPEDSAYDQL